LRRKSTLKLWLLTAESGAEASDVRRLFSVRRRRPVGLSRRHYNNRVQVNHQPTYTALCVLAAKQNAQCISAADWCGPVRGGLFFGISHKSKFVIYHPLSL